jgi:heme-degrading monooxygenase HmoA
VGSANSLLGLNYRDVVSIQFKTALIRKSKIINHMFVRIVKLSFTKHSLFLENFESIKERIRCAPGNRLLELYQDKENKSIFFTYSYWDTEEDLENYRNSEFFNEVWTFTKNYSTANLRLGVWINCLLYLNVFYPELR